MSITIRPAVEADIPRLEDLLYQVHGLHAEGRPDLFTVNILYLNVKFRSVERRFVVCFYVIYAYRVKNLFHKRFGFVPRFIVIDIFALISLTPLTKTESNVFSHS